MDYYVLPLEEVISIFSSNKKSGLSTDEVLKRQKKYGTNALPETKKDSIFKKIVSQFSNVLVLVLIFAALVSLVLGEKLDAYVVLTIVLLNAIMGYVQEAKAEQALAALKKLGSSYSKVIRNEVTLKIDAKDLVPGDIILLENGDKVPADCRLIEAINLEISESILTGEAKSVKKHTAALKSISASLADRTNMVFKDTTVMFGRGKAIVVKTGTSTEIGKISVLLQSQHNEQAPLAVQLDSLGKRLSLFAGLIIIFIFVGGIVTGQFNLRDAFFTAVSLAVAAIPEGLPAIVTIVLAIGVSRLSRANAVIRKLNSVETLGSTNYILTDKTGTLTENKMTVTDIAFINKTYKINENSFYVEGDIKKIDASLDDSLIALLNSSVICSDVQESGVDRDHVTYLGDPTEIALIECAVKAGINIKELQDTYKRIYEIPFSSDTKKMVVVVKNPLNDKKVIVMAKGAPEVIGWMVTQESEIISEVNSKYTRQGLRGLAFSFKEISTDEYEKALKLPNPEDILSTYHTFMGIMAQKDPLRPEIKAAMLNARSAGIETIMLTGDNKHTAIAIAREIGLIKSDDQAVEGSEIAFITQKELLKLLKKVRVFARVSPEEKLKVVQALRSKGNIVAVTGDGVNDAPAIKAADIGIAMGISGTDVSKEVSDMVLQDDNYATIVEAIKQGRIVYDNLVKFIKYLISCNISEILIVGISVFMGLPLPLLPIQILWINLVTDGFPALALGMEPGELDIMLRKPRNPSEGILVKARWIRIFFESSLITLSSLAVYIYSLNYYGEDLARTAVLATLSFSQILHTFNNRSETHSIFSKDLARNQNLNFTVLLSFGLQLGVLYSAIGNYLFKTVPMNSNLLGLCIILAFLPVLGTEIFKYMLSNRSLKTEYITHK